MPRPIQITFRDIEPIESVRAYVEERVAKLHTFHPDILSCRVALEDPHRHHLHGGHYRVRLDVAVPGEEVVVGRDAPDKRSHEDLYAAIDDAVEHMKRALKERLRRQRNASRRDRRGAPSYVEPAEERAES
jgi:ribosomal subunit interface protein